MKHEKIKQLLPLYIDNDLTDEEKKLISNHLENCGECRKELKQYQENHYMLSSLKRKTAPADFVEAILNKVDKDTQDKKSQNTGWQTILKKMKNFFTLPVRVPAGVIGLTAVILILTITGLPGALFNNLDSPEKDFQIRDGMPEYQQQDYNQKYQYSQDIGSAPDTGVKKPEENNKMLTDATNIEFEQKLIKRANLIIEIKDMNKINNNLTNLVKKHRGYISDSRSWLNMNNQKFYSVELRVPVENFDMILEQLENREYGQIISSTITTQDVTEEYIDINIRLDNLILQEERYRQLLDKAAEVEDILKIENELNRVRTEIERLQGRKKYLDAQINFCAINIEFRQPAPINSGTTDLFKAVRNAVSKMIDQFYRIIILSGTIANAKIKVYQN